MISKVDNIWHFYQLFIIPFYFPACTRRKCPRRQAKHLLLCNLFSHLLSWLRTHTAYSRGLCGISLVFCSPKTIGIDWTASGRRIPWQARLTRETLQTKTPSIDFLWGMPQRYFYTFVWISWGRVSLSPI